MVQPSFPRQIDEHKETLVAIAQTARLFRREGDDILIQIDECGGFSGEVTVYFAAKDIKTWENSGLSNKRLLDSAVVVTD